MKVMDAAQTIGLTAPNGEVTGTIDELKVLDVLTRLAESDPGNRDLYASAAAQVRGSRSAGVELVDDRSSLLHDAGVSAVQLRYRSEMTELFTDLAIDVGMRTMRVDATT